MRTITDRELEQITDLSAGGATPLPESVIEKDLLITEVLDATAQADFGGVQFVFCGGTCLSKSYRLIERMSEDVDFKVVVPGDLSRSARSRTLSRLKKTLIGMLEDRGFAVPSEKVIARDENNYIGIDLHYGSRFPAIESLRPEIKLEINARPPVLPTKRLPIQSMLDGLIGKQVNPVLIDCISIEETLAEKVLSFLRRTSEMMAGRNRGDYDDRLVRHLYDSHAIVNKHSGLEEAWLFDHFAAMVNNDATQFRNQYPEFEQDPVGQLRVTLEMLQDNPARFERDYGRFVDDLVFGDPVHFPDARGAFVEIAARLVESLAPRSHMKP